MIYKTHLILGKTSALTPYTVVKAHLLGVKLPSIS